MTGLPPERFTGGGQLRVSDAERDHVALRLRQAAEEGRLDFGELEDRLDRVFNAKTYDDLEGIIRDLPSSTGELERVDDPGESILPTRSVSSEVSSVFRNEQVSGRWLVPSRLTVKSFAGSVTLDFSSAVMPHEVIIDANVVMGSLKLTVPDDVAVVYEDGTTIWSDRQNKTTIRPELGTPVIRVRGTLFMAEVHARPPRKKRRWFRRSSN